MQSDRSLSSGQFPAIQILRAVAALAIVASHSLHEASLALHEANLASNILGRDFVPGIALPLIAGVDLFFVISGFVMVYASRNLFGVAGAQTVFVRKRLARIVPLYWGLTAAFLALSMLGVAPLNRVLPSMMEVISSFLFIPYARPDGYIQPIFSLGWTLNYEIFFYALFATVLPLSRRIAVPLLLLTLVALVALGTFVPESAVQLHFWTRPIILEFGMGVIIGQLALAGFRLSRSMGMAALMLALALFALGQARPDLMPANRAYLYGIPCAILVLSALGFSNVAPTSLAGRVLVTLGDSSYALYLIHPFVLRGLSVLVGLALVKLSPWLLVLVGMLLSSLVAWLVWNWFERPVTKALQGSRLQAEQG